MRVPGRLSQIATSHFDTGTVDSTTCFSDSTVNEFFEALCFLRNDRSDGGTWISLSAHVAYDRAYRGLHLYGLRKAGGSASREEVADEAAAHTLRVLYDVGYEKVETDIEIVPFLLRVAENFVFASLRATARRRRRTGPLTWEPEARPATKGSAFFSDPLERVRRAVERLPDRQREVLMRRLIESETVREIAISMNLPRRLVSNLLDRAKEQVRRSQGKSRRKPR